MTQAITDIKELVGEMPARRCEYLDEDLHSACDRDSKWMVRMHLAHWRDGECEVVTWAVCDGHKNLIEAAAKYFRGVTCTACDTTLDAVFKVMPL